MFNKGGKEKENNETKQKRNKLAKQQKRKETTKHFKLLKK